MKFITCIGVDFDNAYIPHFTKFYKQFNLESYNFILNTNVHDKEKIEEAKKLIFKHIENPNIVVWEGEFNPEKKSEYINDFVDEEKWNLVVDVDEFIDLNNLPKIDEICIGRMCDRISKEGMKELDDSDIFKQFPIYGNYSQKLNAVLIKPVIFKGQKLEKFLHQTTKHSLENIRRSDFPIVKIDHFKWVKSTKDKLKRRKKTYKKLNYKWWRESEIALSFF